MKIQWKTLLLNLFVPLTVGVLASLLTENSMETFAQLNKPAFAPPGWLFPVVWTILYLLMGTASYLVVSSGQNQDTALLFYGLQLFFNFFWSVLFFNLGQYLFAFMWLILLWLLILKTIILFFPVSKAAGYLMIPYLLWVTFAGYLNYAVWLLN